MFIMYGKENCKFCDMAKNLLKSKNKDYTYIDVMNIGIDNFITDMNKMGGKTKTVPQIFLDKGDVKVYIGGFQELKKFLE